MKSVLRLILLLVILSITVLSGGAGVTSTSFLDLEDSSDNALCTINNWYNLAWYWRKPIIINNGGGALTDYQVKVTVNTQELITAGKMEADGDDIRFSESDGTSNIPYWIESGINTTSTDIWVKVPSVPNGDSTIYMYYSNPGASANSSLSDTFTSGSFQDLFNDITKLDDADSSTIAVTPGEAQLLVADTEILDVNQVLGTNGVGIYDQQWLGQTFYANLDGFLTKATIRVNKQGNPPNALEIQIRNTVGNLPGTTIYATASRDDITTLGNYDFNFNMAAPVTAGTRYAIVTKTIGGDASNYYNAYYNANVYPGGRAVLSTNNGSSWNGYDVYDYYCKTYISSAAKLDQNQIASSTNWPVYGDNWSAQSFITGATGNLTMVVLNASTTGSPPNNLTVEVQDAQEYIDEVVDQSQTSYSGERQTYGINWWAQTFRAGSSGDLSKVTIRASETGNPPNGLTVELRNVTTGSQESEDQSQTSYTGERQVYGSNWESQIFQAGLSDNLTKVTLRAAKTGSPPNDLTVELRDVSGGSEENLDQNQTSYTDSYGIYSNTWLAETFQAGATGDLSKVTMALARVEDEDQSQTSYTGDRQIYGNNWRAQIFEAGTSDDLSKITIRTSKTGSPANDLIVELRNTIIGYQETEDQSQTSFTGDRQVYGNNWEGQVFQAGASGNLSKVTLRASKTGSPANDLTVELRNTVSGYQETEDQSQTSFTGDRQIFGNNWRAQIFEAGASGNLSKVTLRASKMGSPPNNLTVELQDAVLEEVLDQSQTSYNNNYAIYNNIWVAQTFQAGVTGELTKVTITVSKTGSPPPLDVQIRNVSGVLPGTTVYATASRSDIGATGQYDFTFSTPASVTSGTSYAIVVKTAGGDASNNYPISYQNANLYANGNACASINGGSSWIPYTNLDTYFRVYVTLDEYIPGGTVYATASRSDITTAGEYDFTYSTPYSIISGTKYALVINTNGGDASNYYGVSYQASDNYADGRECSSTDGGTTWAGSSSTDLYFKTYVPIPAGFRPGGTVYATASRSDIISAGEYDFTYSTPYSVTSGTKYALVIYTSGGDASNYYGVSYQNSNVYANGRECSSTDGGSIWTGSDSTDLYFRTYVVQEAGLIPGGTVHATASRSDITTAGEYDFTFSSACSVTSGTKYAIVIYTSSGDGSNYYNVSYQNSNAYASGRECSSTSGGSTWTGSDSTDLYFRTKMGNPLGTIDVQIRNCTVDNLPGTTVYATASKNPLDIGTSFGTYDFTFSSPASVTSGVKYSIVIKTGGGDAANNYPIYYQNSNVYSSGRVGYSSDSGNSWTGYDVYDLYFQTYVTASAYTPGTTVYATASRSDIAAAREYDFIFSPPYAVTASTKYALVIYTSGGDASNYYSVSYQNSNAYANGRECYSSNDGSDWTGSSSTDLYFRTYITVQVGDTPGGTVYASASRSDITTAGEYDFTFSTPYSVTAETNYAIVVYTSGGNIFDYYGVGYQNSDAYDLGKECASTDSGSSWTPNSSADLYFKTYISSATGTYIPGGAVYASASRNNIGSSVNDQVFFFSTPAAVSSGTRYTIVVKTTGGDASNHYNVSCQSADVYSNGVRSYSSNGGTDWTPADTSDLWFKTYVEYVRSVSASGILRSVTIPANSDARFATGVQLSWNDTKPGSSDIKYQLEYYTGSTWNLIPDSALSGNSAGFDSSPVNISSVLTDYSQVRVRANLSSSSSIDIPGVRDWILTYYYRNYSSPEPGVTEIGTEE